MVILMDQKFINMKKIFVFILLYSITHQGFSQNLILNKKMEIKVTKFSNELQTFIKACNNEAPKLCQYFVYVVYAYPLNNQEKCIGYTVSYIFNSSDLNNIKPQYYYSDSINLIVVRFNPRIKEESIPGLKLNKIVDSTIIYNKLLPEKKGFITGISRAFIYNDCPHRKERINYESLDMVPKEKSIFTDFLIGIEIKLIKEGRQDSIKSDSNK
jgi:hypothetical protein